MRDYSYDAQIVTGAKDLPESMTIRTANPLVLTQITGVDLTDRVVVVPSSADLTVFADELIIYGHVSLPGRRVNLICRRLIGRKGSDGKAPCIDVTGEEVIQTPSPGWPHLPAGKTGGSGGDGWGGGRGAGAQNDAHFHGAEGRRGLPGQPGGTVHIGCLDLHCEAPFKVVANGSNGTNGLAGQPGRDGGRGGDGWHPAEFFVSMGMFTGTKGGQGGDGGNGGRGGAAGAPGTPGNIIFRCARKSGESFTTVCNAGQPGQPGAGGAHGRGGRPGVGGKTIHVNSESTHGQGYVADRSLVSVGDNGYGNDGAQGREGDKKDPVADNKPDVVTQCADTQLVSHIKTPMAKADGFEQLQMLFRTARLRLLKADKDNPESFRPPLETLRWIRAVLDSVLGDARNDPAHQAKLVAPLDLSAAVDAVCTNIVQGKNIFGHDPAWVPLGDYDDYKNAFGEMLKFLQDTEATTDEVMQEAKDAKAEKGHANAIIRQAHAVIKSATERLNAVEAAIPGVEREIRRMDQTAVGLAKDFTIQASSFEKKINEACGVTPANLLQSLGTLSFLPRMDPRGNVHSLNQAFMLGAEGGKLATDALTKVTTSSGAQVDKSYVINQVENLKEDINSLDETVKVVGNAYVPSDPNGYQLRTTQQKVDQLLNQFRDKVEAHNLHETLTEYVRVITARNEKIASYNGLFAQVVDLRAQIDGATHRIALAEADLAANAKPNALAIRNYVSTLYFRAQEDCIRALDILSRSYNYKSLSDVDALSTTLALGDPVQIDALTLGKALEELEEKLFSVSTLERKPFPDPTAAAPAPIIAEFTLADNPRLFADLAEAREDPDAPGAYVHSMLVTLPHAGRSASLDQVSADFSPFASLWNVRLARVRAFLPGVGASTGDLHIGIRQTGAEVVCSPEGKPIRFKHDGRHTDFVYRVLDFRLESRHESVVRDGDLEHNPDPDRLAQLTRLKLSPFATWEVSLRTTTNPGLDVSRADRLILEFEGSYTP